MEKFLHPEQFEATPNMTAWGKVWLNRKQTSNTFISSIFTKNETLDKLNVLTNYVSPTGSEYIPECSDFDLAMKILESTFIT